MFRRTSIVLLAAAMTILPSALFSAEQRARLELSVEQKRFGTIEVIFRGDDIMTRPSDLKAAGIDSSGGRVETLYGVQHVSLKSLARELSFELNEADLNLRITLKQSAKNPRASSPPTVLHPPPVKGATAKPRLIADNTLRQARLALQLDDVRKGEINVILRDQDMLVRSKDLTLLATNIAVGQQELIRGETYVSLKTLSPNFTYALDTTDLSLRVTSNPAPVTTNVTSADPSPATSLSEREESVRIDRRPAADQRAILEIVVNSEKKGETDVILRGDDVLARVTDLQSVGMASVDGRKETIGGDSFVSLRSLAPLLLFNVNEKDLALDLTLRPDAFSAHVFSGRDFRPEKMEYREDPSGFVNYAVSANNFKSVDAFGEVGITIKNALVYSSVSRNLDGEIVRGLTNVTISDRDRNVRTVIGDRLVNSDSLGGSLTMGGLSYFRDFSLDPYFIRNPGLNYSGAVATPSTLDVYSNGRLVRRIALPPGQFQLNDLPIPAGTNNTRFVLRDPFGQERELSSQFFYFTSGLLKPGLHDFSYNLGSRRDDLANRNWRYDSSPVFLGYHRYGFTDSMTAGLRLEGSRGLMSGGPSFSFLLPLGELDLASAASTVSGRNGGASYLGYSYINGLFSFGSSIKLQSGRYANTNLDLNTARPWLESGIYLAVPVTDLTTVNLRHAFAQSRQDGPEHRFQLFTSTRLHRNLTLFTGASYELRDRNRAIGASAGLGFSFGEVGGSLSYQREDGKNKGTLDFRKNLPIGPGYGYGIQASANGDFDSIVQYQTSFGRYEANYSRFDGQQGSRLSAAGGLAFIDGSVQLTRPVQDSFALIKVPGLSGVRGYLNNLDVGKTDSNGRLFVPNLLAYYGNQLAISKKDLPFNYNVDITDKIIAAPYRGGALVEFPAARIQRVVGKTMIDRAGKTIVPQYGQLTIVGQSQSFESPLGNTGEFYFENLKSGRYQAQIETKDENCEFYLDVPSTSNEIIELGLVTCMAN